MQLGHCVKLPKAPTAGTKVVRWMKWTEVVLHPFFGIINQCMCGL